MAYNIKPTKKGFQWHTPLENIFMQLNIGKTCLVKFNRTKKGMINWVACLGQQLGLGLDTPVPDNPLP